MYLYEQFLLKIYTATDQTNTPLENSKEDSRQDKRQQKRQKNKPQRLSLKRLKMISMNKLKKILVNILKIDAS